MVWLGFRCRKFGANASLKVTKQPGNRIRLLSIRVERRLNSRDVLDELGELFVRHGPPEHIRSDNGPEFIATALREWLGRLGTKTLFIEPGSPWENGYCESFNSKLRDELLAREIFYDLREAKAHI